MPNPTLPPLAVYVDALINSTTGQQKRIDFNEKDFRTLKTALPIPDDLAAFLTMDKSAIAGRVLEDLAPNNDDFTQPVADLYAQWIKSFGPWPWAQEESLYKINCADFGSAAAYTWPECRIISAKATKTGSTPDSAGRYPVSVRVDGEGFLPDCQMRVFYRGTEDPENVYTGTLDNCSTFRGGRVSINTFLKPGQYRAEVHNDLGQAMGKPVYQKIGSTGVGHFDVA